MDELFKEILSQNSDPRPKINEALAEFKVWSTNFVSFKDECYSRNIICKTDNLNEIVLACWKKDQITTFHTHPNQSCWIYVLKGEFEETRVESKIDFAIKDKLVNWSEFKTEYQNHHQWNEFESSKKLSLISAGQWNYIDDSLGFHRMRAKTDEVISLHIYRQLGI